MAGHRRARPRHRTYSRTKSMSSWPRWWDILHHNRPRRRRDRATEGLVIRGADPDGLCWELSRRPHKYYW